VVAVPAAEAGRITETAERIERIEAGIVLARSPSWSRPPGQHPRRSVRKTGHSVFDIRTK